jgi:hypothetical protein
MSRSVPLRRGVTAIDGVMITAVGVVGNAKAAGAFSKGLWESPGDFHQEEVTPA